MKTGKITNSVISRSVLKNIKPAKNSLTVKPSIGADASVLENGIVIASDSDLNLSIQHLTIFMQEVEDRSISSAASILHRICVRYV